MKFSESLLVSVVVATNSTIETLPLHPLQKLRLLVDRSADLLNQSFTELRSKDVWIIKFKKNARRMEIAFRRYRCRGKNERKKRASEENGTEIDELEKIENGCKVTKHITQGFKDWTDEYLGKCRGQVQFQHQTNRMKKWNKRLQGFLGCT